MGGEVEEDVDDDRTKVWLTRTVIAIAVLTLIGFGTLWPRGEAPDLGAQPGNYVDATVTDSVRTTCEGVEVLAPVGCFEVDVEITSGADAGEAGVFVVRDTEFGIPELEVGDRVVLLDVPTSPPPFRYTYSDFQRATPMWWLLGLFVAAVIAVGRWQGVRALAGLAASGLILVMFVVPSLIRDEPAVLVALTGTIAVAYLALYLAHGFHHTTTVALAGTLASLALITALALLVAEVAQLSGLANEEAQALRVTASALDLRGLLIAGIVVGALGVLDDVTVTQVSAVAALKRADPDLGHVALYREAMRIGRDHVASVVNTLVLAYAGASLPLVLLFSQGAKSTGRIITSEIVAVEVVRMLVGSIGLIVAVPITTALAAVVLTGREDPHGGHSHGLHSHGPHDHGGHDRGGDPRTREPEPKSVTTDRTEPDWDDFGPRADPI